MKTLRKLMAAVMAMALMVTLVNPVTSEAAAKVKLNKTKATLTITDKKKKPTITLKLAGTSKKAAWSTSNKAVATVSGGKVTAKKAGKATITCKVSGKKYTCKVTVKDKRLKLNKTRVDLTITDSVKNPTVTLKVKNAKGKAAWSSSRPSVATVSNGKVTAHEDGSATITCKVDGKALTCKVYVDDARAKENTGSDGGNGNDTTTSYGSIVCWCGYTVEKTAPLGTDTENKKFNDHAVAHSNKGERVAYTGTKKPCGAIICQCGWILEQTVPGCTDEENERHQDHAMEHLLKGESTSYTNVAY